MATLTQIVQLATPFATFALGYVTKTYTDRRERRRLVVSELVALALEWYEQMRKLVEESQFGSDEAKMARQEFEYLTGRSILPRYVALLVRLGRSRGKKSEIYREAVGFLLSLTTGEGLDEHDIDFDRGAYLTDWSPHHFVQTMADRLLGVTAKRMSNLRASLPHKTYNSDLLESLDRRIQRLAALSGKIA